MLHPGESRAINTPLGFYLTESVRIQRINGFCEFEVYRSGQPCPSLSGPRTELTNSYGMNISFGSYEYDRYFLNQGSTIEVTLSAISGEARLQVFSGFSSFQCWADPKCQLLDASQVLHTSYVFAPRCYDAKEALGEQTNATSTWCDNTPSWKKSIANATHFKFTSSESHTLILVYEGVTGNALKGVRNKLFEGNATVQVNMASYDLSGFKLVQQSSCPVDGSGCMIPTTPWAWAECIILLAVPSTDVDGSENIQYAYSKGINRAHVAVDVKKHQQWIVIFGVSAVPMLLSVMLGMKRRFTSLLTCKSMDDQESSDSIILYRDVDMLFK